jgi:hypothetical protein
VRSEIAHFVRGQKLALNLIAERTARVEVVESVRNRIVPTINTDYLEPLFRPRINDVELVELFTVDATVNASAPTWRSAFPLDELLTREFDPASGCFLSQVCVVLAIVAPRHLS